MKKAEKNYVMNESPLHWCVFENKLELLKQHLSTTLKNEIDKKDVRGKTALELAIFMDRYECAKLLLEHGADCNVITKAGWNLVQEAVSTGNTDMIKLALTHRDYQRNSVRKSGIPELLNKLKQAPDFYVEMKWEFTSWIPLISKACPSDVYRIYKSGSNVRIDTTLIGFNGTSWERGNRSYVFQANTDGSASIIEIDHIAKTYHVDKLSNLDSLDESGDEDASAESLYEPDEYVIQNKLTAPNMVTFLDIEKIEFERNRSGIWGWKTDKSESINGFECKVYTANNLQLVTKTRVEHLNSERAKAFLDELDESEIEQTKQGNIPGFLTNFLQGSEQHIKIEKSNKTLTALEYFQKHVNVDYYLNGSVRNIDETRKIQTFNATLSLCDEYPLSLHEQVLPIVDLMALNNSHFKKLKEFITLQLPSGFPVKIEIPLYRVITAKVTFGNIHALDHSVDMVKTIKNTGVIRAQSSDLIDASEGGRRQRGGSVNGPVMCVVDEMAFKIPPQYRCTNYYGGGGGGGIESSQFDVNRRSGAGGGVSGGAASFDNYRHYGQGIDDDDILLQLAIQQSLAMGSGEGENNEQLTALELIGGRTGPGRNYSGSTQSLQDYNSRRNPNQIISQTDEDLILQRVLAESLGNLSPLQTDLNIRSEPIVPGFTLTDDTLRQALELSRIEEEERRRRQEQEDEELMKIIELSLREK